MARPEPQGREYISGRGLERPQNGTCRPKPEDPPARPGASPIRRRPTSTTFGDCCSSTYQKQMPHAVQPADAARVIYEAATSPEPRLRWLVGEDARLLVAGRPRMSDEEYVASGRALPASPGERSV